MVIRTFFILFTRCYKNTYLNKYKLLSMIPKDMEIII